MSLFKEYEPQIREQAVQAYPLEGIWLVTKAGCAQVENIHEDPENHFRVGIADMSRALSEGLLAIVHSHPDQENVPSAADMQGQINTAVPWGIVTAGAEGCSPIRWFGHETPPLLGRPFVHGITDCYALIKDFYLLKKGVELPEFPRSWGWWNHGQDLFMEGFAKAGFRRISQEEARPGDVWLAKIRSNTVNHGGVLVENDLMLHQMGTSTRPVDAARKSAREPISRYLSHIHIWLRYEG